MCKQAQRRDPLVYEYPAEGQGSLPNRTWLRSVRPANSAVVAQATPRAKRDDAPRLFIASATLLRTVRTFRPRNWATGSSVMPCLRRRTIGSQPFGFAMTGSARLHSESNSRLSTEMTGGVLLFGEVTAPLLPMVLATVNDACHEGMLSTLLCLAEVPVADEQR